MTLERIRFAQGDLLAASDLNRDAAAASRQRALHIRAVHATWGIALGFAVVTDTAGAMVGPGLAYDCRGAELASPTTVLVPPPAGSSGTYDLTICAANDPAPPCPDAAVGRPQVRFGWRAAVAPLALEALVLARFEVSPPGVLGQPSLLPRRCARVMRPPVVGSGSATVECGPGQLRSTAQVDTTAAGFDTAPQYVVTVAGDDAAAVHMGAGAGRLFGPVLSIADEQADAFRIEIRFGLAGAQPGPQLPPKRTLEIAWLGIQPADLWQPPSPTS